MLIKKHIKLTAYKNRQESINKSTKIVNYFLIRLIFMTKLLIEEIVREEVELNCDGFLTLIKTKNS